MEALALGAPRSAVDTLQSLRQLLDRVEAELEAATQRAAAPQPVPDPEAVSSALQRLHAARQAFRQRQAAVQTEETEAVVPEASGDADGELVEESELDGWGVDALLSPAPPPAAQASCAQHASSDEESEEGDAEPACQSSRSAELPPGERLLQPPRSPPPSVDDLEELKARASTAVTTALGVLEATAGSERQAHSIVAALQAAAVALEALETALAKRAAAAGVDAAGASSDDDEVDSSEIDTTADQDFHTWVASSWSVLERVRNSARLAFQKRVVEALKPAGWGAIADDSSSSGEAQSRLTLEAVDASGLASGVRGLTLVQVWSHQWQTQLQVCASGGGPKPSVPKCELAAPALWAIQVLIAPFKSKLKAFLGTLREDASASPSATTGLALGWYSERVLQSIPLLEALGQETSPVHRTLVLAVKAAEEEWLSITGDSSAGSGVELCPHSAAVEALAAETVRLAVGAALSTQTLLASADSSTLGASLLRCAREVAACVTGVSSTAPSLVAAGASVQAAHVAHATLAHFDATLNDAQLPPGGPLVSCACCSTSAASSLSFSALYLRRHEEAARVPFSALPYTAASGSALEVDGLAFAEAAMALEQLRARWGPALWGFLTLGAAGGGVTPSARVTATSAAWAALHECNAWMQGLASRCAFLPRPAAARVIGAVGSALSSTLVLCLFDVLGADARLRVGEGTRDEPLIVMESSGDEEGSPAQPPPHEPLVSTTSGPCLWVRCAVRGAELADALVSLLLARSGTDAATRSALVAALVPLSLARQSCLRALELASVDALMVGSGRPLLLALRSGGVPSGQAARAWDAAVSSLASLLHGLLKDEALLAVHVKEGDSAAASDVPAGVPTHARWATWTFVLGRRVVEAWAAELAAVLASGSDAEGALPAEAASPTALRAVSDAIAALDAGIESGWAAGCLGAVKGWAAFVATAASALAAIEGRPLGSAVARSPSSQQSVDLRSSWTPLPLLPAPGAAAKELLMACPPPPLPPASSTMPALRAVL